MMGAQSKGGLECRCLGAAFTTGLSGYAFRIVRGGCNKDGLGWDLCKARILLLTTICPILRYYIGYAEGKWAVRSRGIKIIPGMQCVTPGGTWAAGRKARCEPRDARHGRVARCKARRKPRDARRGVSRGQGSRGESIPPTDESSSGCVWGREEEEGKEGGEELPAHVAQVGTLTSREGVERRGWSMLHRRALSRQDGLLDILHYLSFLLFKLYKLVYWITFNNLGWSSME
jgi:hypothetical protein